jgi:hypothetical protein
MWYWILSVTWLVTGRWFSKWETNRKANLIVNKLIIMASCYSKTCLNRTPLGLKNLFSLDRCLVYTGSNYTHLDLVDRTVTWLVTGRWFSPGILVSSINKIDCHDKTEILLKVVLNAIHLTSHLHIFSISGLWRWGIVSYFTICLWWKLQKINFILNLRYLFWL